MKIARVDRMEKIFSLVGTLSDKANVHRHVGKVIDIVKRRYSMLTGPVESPFTVVDRTSNVSTFDKIVQVACALNNLCISAAPWNERSYLPHICDFYLYIG